MSTESTHNLQVININDKFAQFSDHWNPRIVAQLNGQAVKLAKVAGEFVWHHHQNEDELFWVVRGSLRMGLRDPHERTVLVNEGEVLVVPKGIEHRPASEGEETWIMMFEPTTTLNTGNVSNERTRAVLETL
jgi:mannose-6-phosphate isomerase-like protein (cupin superfamily)